MSGRGLALAVASGRTAVGTALLAAPRLSARAWVGDGGATAVVLVRALGARDALIGAGGLSALRTGRGARGWLVAGAIADVADALATFAARERLPGRARLVVTLGAAGAIASVAAATSLD
ncbi:MAG: hypothetical protein NVSMB25_04110 [Thermoleophilaceae bacterium]